jgi:hypothetical protein
MSWLRLLLCQETVKLLKLFPDGGSSLTTWDFKGGSFWYNKSLGCWFIKIQVYLVTPLLAAEMLSEEACKGFGGGPTPSKSSQVSAEAAGLASK